MRGESGGVGVKGNGRSLAWWGWSEHGGGRRAGSGFVGLGRRSGGLGLVGVGVIEVGWGRGHLCGGMEGEGRGIESLCLIRI